MDVEELLFEDTPRVRSELTLAHNVASLIDSPWQNPFADPHSETHHYLAIDSEKITAVKEDQQGRVFHQASFTLSSKKYIRNRTVSNAITLIAEVSGFADIFIVSGTFVMGILNQALMQSSVAKLMGRDVELPSKRRKGQEGNSKPVQLMHQILGYRTFRESVLMALYTAWCPRCLLTYR